MNNETLSIVIPVYNEASSLIELYEEIKVNVSSFSLWEILFIDDGSTDDSGEIIRSLHEKDKRIKLIQFQSLYDYNQLHHPDMQPHRHRSQCNGFQ